MLIIEFGVLIEEICLHVEESCIRIKEFLQTLLSFVKYLCAKFGLWYDVGDLIKYMYMGGLII